jgi:hypothetical protein
MFCDVFKIRVLKYKEKWYLMKKYRIIVTPENVYKSTFFHCCKRKKAASIFETAFKLKLKLN